jgi:hypothetical protein
LREQREKRARALAAAAPASAPTPVAAPAPATVAKAAPASKQAKASRAAKGRAAAASAAARPAQEPVAVVAPEPELSGPSPAALRSPMGHIAESHQPVDELYARARALELQMQTAQAVTLYREASQRGHAPSSRRLMELYADGAPGVARDYRVAVFFKERAVQQGVSFEPAWRR